MSIPGLNGLSLLVLEDETLLRKQIVAHLQSIGADVTGVGNLDSAKRLLRDLDFDFSLIDVNLPDGQGTDLLRQKLIPAHTGVVVMTADGGVAGAVEAMQLGASDYLVKPFEVEELPLVIERARRARQKARIEEHRRNDATQSGEGFYFGQTLASLERQLQKILAADERMKTRLPPILIEGETGTGKTTIARWLHHQGPRARQPLVEMNCSALPETLAESELFGHERGAFTDARSARIGLFEAAHGGTLFLDELPSLSLSLQAKVLKAVEDHKIRRLGGNKEIPVDARLMAASHRNLRELVAAGEFREDLYHRLDLYRLVIPPLRERREEIPILADKLMDRLCGRHRLPRKTITATGRQRLLNHPWPGNVRELAHELERALVFEEGARLEFDQLQTVLGESHGRGRGNADWFDEGYTFPQDGFKLEEAINRLIQHALKQTQGNVSAAARILGVSRDYLRYRLSNSKGNEDIKDGE